MARPARMLASVSAEHPNRAPMAKGSNPMNQQVPRDTVPPEPVAMVRPTVAAPEDLPSVCPTCGGYTLKPEHSVSVLLAVCDVLVMKSLEKMGNYIIRAERSRYHVMKDRPAYVAHTLWPTTDEIVAKALKGAWDVVPYVLQTHGQVWGTDPDALVQVLNKYVADLAVTGDMHTTTELKYRMNRYLGLPVFNVEVSVPINGEHEHDHDGA